MVNHQGSSNPCLPSRTCPSLLCLPPPYASHIRLTDARRRYDPPIIQTSHQFLQGRLASIFLSFLILSLPLALLSRLHMFCLVALLSGMNDFMALFYSLRFPLLFVSPYHHIPSRAPFPSPLMAPHHPSFTPSPCLWIHCLARTSVFADL